MRNFLQGFRLAARKLRMSPALTLVGMLTLGLGIAATISVFSVVEAVLLRPLPFPHSEQLISIRESAPQVNEGRPLNITAKDVITFSKEMRTLENAGGYYTRRMELSGAGDPVRIATARMTASLFPLLAVSPMLGRTFTAEEDQQQIPVVVLSYQAWVNRFHGDNTILNTTVNLDRKPYTVIGVMPAGFEFPLIAGREDSVEAWTPMSFTPQEAQDPASNWDFGFVGRLRPGATIQQAQADAERITAMIVAAYPPFMKSLTVKPVVQSLKQDTVQGAAPLVRLLFLAVLVVLLIACANLAGLLLVRAIRRKHEVAVQMALGARASTLLAQAMFESLLISLGGGIVGIGLAAFILQAWVKLLPETLPRIGEIGMNGRVVFFALLLVIATGILCGLAPSFAAMRVNLNDSLKEGGRSGTGSTGHSKLRAILVISEIATALVLLTGAGLLVRSFQKMRDVDPGFRHDHLITAHYSLPDQQYKSQAQVDNLHRELLTRLTQQPQIQSATISTGLPMLEASNTSVFSVEGYDPGSKAPMNLGSYIDVLGDYFRTTGIPILRGRPIEESDVQTSRLVVVVNRTMAEHFWPGEDPIGKRIKAGTSSMDTPWETVVGVVSDTKQGSLDSENIYQIYRPLPQVPASLGKLWQPTDIAGDSVRVAVRTSGDPRAAENLLRKTIWSLDPQLAVAQVKTMDETISETEAPRRFNTLVVTGFAAGAVLLAMLGIYVVVAFSVNQRLHEMGIRIALGAQGSDILGMVLRSGVKLAAIGCAIGIAGAMVATRLLTSMLFGVSSFDPMVYAAAITAIVMLSLLASILPARRAASVEPMTVLRSE